jgi:hypothetical protein
MSFIAEKVLSFVAVETKNIMTNRYKRSTMEKIEVLPTLTNP